MLLNCGVREDSWESVGLQGDQTSQSQRESILNIHWKDMLKLKLQYFGQLMRRINSLEKTLMLGKIESRKSRQQRMRQLYGIINLMDMNLSKFQEMVKDRESCHAAVNGVAKSQKQLRDWTTTIEVPWQFCFVCILTDDLFKISCLQVKDTVL